MNQRLKELVEQASSGACYDEPGAVTLYNDEIKKFAELIVRECVKVMYDNAIERKVPPDINQTPTHYAIAVLEHFSIE